MSDRMRITTWRTIARTAGSFLFLAIPAVRQQIIGVGDQPGEVLTLIAGIACFAVPALAALPAFTIVGLGPVLQTATPWHQRAGRCT